MRVAPITWLAAATLVAVGTAAHADTLLVPEDHTLAAALEAANPGDTISVAGGTLDGGAVVLNRGVTLESRVPLGNRIDELDVLDLPTAAVVRGFRIGSGTFEQSRVNILSSAVAFFDCAFDGIFRWEFSFVGYTPYAIGIGGLCDILFDGCTFRDNHSEGFADGNLGWLFEAPEPTGPLRFTGCVFEDLSLPVSGGDMQVTIEDCEFRGTRGWMIHSRSSLQMRRCLVARHALVEDADYHHPECYGYTEGIAAYGAVEIANCTFVDSWYDHFEDGLCPLPTPAQTGAMVSLGSQATGSVHHNLFIGQPGAAVNAPAAVNVSCNDAFQSADVHWRGGIGDVTGVNGNFSQAPLFCGRAAGDYTISIYSPAAPEHSGGCGLIGALGTNCETEVATLVKRFTAWRDPLRTGNAVELRWELSRPLGVVIRRYEADRRLEVHQADASAAAPVDRFLDEAAPAQSARYALGIVQDGVELFPIAWADVGAAVPVLRSRIAAVSPNPFNPSTVVRFVVAPSSTAQGAASSAPGAGGNLATPAAASGARPVLLTIHDLAGREVARLVDSALPLGPHEIAWNGLDGAGRAVASGVYLAVLTVEGVRQHTQKLALVR